jgi:hypothetical protein
MSFPAEEAIMDSVSLAAAYAHHHVESMVCDPLDGVRATWRLTPLTVREPGKAPGIFEDADGITVQDDIPQTADGTEVLRRILQERAEPTHEFVLRTGLLAALGQTGVLTEIVQQTEGEQTPLAVLRAKIDRAFSSTSVHEIEPHRWWLTLSSSPSRPLADRVELRARDLLREREEWHGDDLLHQLYRDFPDHLTPDRALVATVIHSYAEDLHFEHTPLAVLRAEDRAEVRATEVDEVCQLLAQTGTRLGVEVSSATHEGEQQRIVWSTSGETIYTFFIQATAEVLPLLRTETGVLIIPGGRATLLQHKIARDARLRKTHWQVLKFSSLRRAAQQADLSLAAFPLAFGLEPPIEQPALQIQLL